MGHHNGSGSYVYSLCAEPGNTGVFVQTLYRCVLQDSTTVHGNRHGWKSQTWECPGVLKLTCNTAFGSYDSSSGRRFGLIYRINHKVQVGSLDKINDERTAYTIGYTAGSTGGALGRSETGSSAEPRTASTIIPITVSLAASGQVTIKRVQVFE